MAKKNFFGKLLDKLSVRDEETVDIQSQTADSQTQIEEEQLQEPQTDAPEKEVPSDGIMNEEAILNAVHAKIRQLFAGKQKLLTDRTIVFWVADGALLLLMDNQEFHDRLLCSIVDDGFPIHDVAISSGKAPDGATPVLEAVAMVITGAEVPPIDARAEITIFEGRGTLAQGKYELTAQGAPYAIGRDATGENAIAIRGSKDDPNYERNKYVRSHHARIEFMGKHGFRLIVEPDGTYSVGSRTQIRRSGMPSLIELNNPSQPVQLLDGDVIILGKNVELLWKTK